MRVDKKYLVFNDDSHEFNVEIKNGKKTGNDKFVLKRSHNTVWTNPGEKIMTAVDDGNSILIDGTYYEYCEFMELYSLMTTIIESQEDQWGKIRLQKDVNSK